MSRNYKKLGIERSESLQWPLWQQLIWALQGVFFIDKSLQAAPRCVQKEPGWKTSTKINEVRFELWFSVVFWVKIGYSWVLLIFSIHFSSRVRGVPGADAFEHVLMSALKSYSVIWDSFRAFATFAAFLHFLLLHVKTSKCSIKSWNFVHMSPRFASLHGASLHCRTWFMMHPHACWISWWGAELAATGNVIRWCTLIYWEYLECLCILCYVCVLLLLLVSALTKWLLWGHCQSFFQKSIMNFSFVAGLGSLDGYFLVKP